MNVGINITRAKHMKSGIWMVGVLLVLLAVACSSGFTRPTETRDDSFAVGESPRVVVSNDHGRIIINPGTGGTVRVQATLRNPDDLEYDTTQEGDTISVEAKETGDTSGADIEITAPSNTRVELRTSKGKIEVYGMHGSGTMRTSNGKIVMEDVVGDFDISTTSAVAQASGTFDVEAINGRIEFGGELAPGGNNRMKTINGSVEIKLRGTPSIKLDASTRNGSVTTRFPILTTSPGDERHVVGTIGAGEAELFVRTSNGSITIQ